MSPEDAKAIIREHAEVLFNQHRVDRTDETVAPDYLDHAPVPGQEPGLAGAKKKWAMYLAAIPDLRVAIEEMVAEGDKVAVQWTGHGTHRAELFGIPPTNKPVRLNGISIYRVADGKIAEQQEQWDRLGLLQQLGVIPPVGSKPAAGL
jgi:steroid delta-isomerase-like uncharacterized protein